MEIESNRKEYESLHPYNIAIAGLHVTSRWPSWWSRTKAILSSGNKNFHVNSLKKKTKHSTALTTNMAALSRGCKPRIAGDY